MNTLYLIRHAKSSWDYPELRDVERPLNKRGRRDAPFMASLLKGKGVQPDLLVSSPATRAYSTAVYFAEALDYPAEAIRVVPTIYHGGEEDVLQYVRQLDDRYHTVLLFGHNPVLTALANRFSQTYISNVPTCGIVRIDSPHTTWSNFSKTDARMVEFLYPKQYFT